MIISNNREAEIRQFAMLMEDVDKRLNADARTRGESYYKGRNGTLLELDVFDTMKRCARGSIFEGTIYHKAEESASAFPDIIANKYLGVEVKSTKENKWTSIGSSILESTRIPGIERIFLTFGKLGTPVQFMTRRYEECLSGVAVTHYPRYQIDMQLSPGQTIFDKMNVPYDVLRQMNNPVEPVAAYYKSLLKPGERLWWTGKEPEEVAVPVNIRVWSNVPYDLKNECKAYGVVYFPDLLWGQYDRYAAWLVARHGIIDTHIRDQFSAGGQVTVTASRWWLRDRTVPAVYRRIEENKDEILKCLKTADPIELEEAWERKYVEDPLKDWCYIAADNILNNGRLKDPPTLNESIRIMGDIFDVSLPPREED